MDSLTDLLAAVPALHSLVPYALVLIGACALLMPWLPVPASKSSAYGICYAVLNAISNNFRNAANAAKPGDQVKK